MSTTHIALTVLLGLGLSASTGLNTFLPLLLLAGAARFNIAGIELGDKFGWLTSDVAIFVLIVACIVELIADKVPAVDHFLDSIGTFIRPVVATVASAAALTGADVDPTIAAVMGLMIGAPISLGFHTLKASTRVMSSAATLGCANPLLSVLEDIASLVMSLIAIFLPLFVPVALALFALALWKMLKSARSARAANAPVRSAP